MNPQETIEKIQNLHTLYVSLTGQNILLRTDREHLWFDWIARGWGEKELRIVIGGIWAGIKLGKRNLGAFKFTNLIGQLDKFEEDLAMFQSAAKASAPRRPVHVPKRPDGRAMPQTAAGLKTERQAHESAAEILRKCREQLKGPSQ